LAAFTGRSVLGMVADRDSAVGSTAAGGHPRHYQPGEAVASHREDARSHGAKTTDRCSRTVRTDDDIIEHLQRWPGDHGDSNVGRSAIVEDNEASTDSGASPIVLWPGEPRILYATFHGETSKPIKGHNYVAQGFLAKTAISSISFTFVRMIRRLFFIITDFIRHASLDFEILFFFYMNIIYYLILVVTRIVCRTCNVLAFDFWIR